MGAKRRTSSPQLRYRLVNIDDPMECVNGFEQRTFPSFLAAAGAALNAAGWVLEEVGNPDDED